MIVNKALMAAAVLLFAAPLVPSAVAHDDYGDHGEHLRLHRDVSEARYVRCLECPGNWDNDYGWRRHHGWRRYYGGWYGGWRYPGWRHHYGWRHPGWRYGGWDD